MALASAQVINAITQRLSGTTAATSRVYAGRGWALDESELPAWVITAQDESIELQTVHYPALQRHTLSIDASAKVRATADVDDAMHAIAEQGLSALQGSESAISLEPLNGVTLTLEGISRELVAQGESAIGVITLKLIATFSTAQNAPGTFI